jgi:hypothetical protein
VYCYMDDLANWAKRIVGGGSKTLPVKID